MKLPKISKLAMLAVMCAGALFFTVSCSDDDDDSSKKSTPALYKDFYNYPTGKMSSKGMLKLTNEVNSKVLVFTDSVAPANYIGTIPALESIQVALDAGKFYSLVAVTKDAYEKDQTLAAQSSVLAYYSNTQAYSVSVSPENMTGSATWIFNNNTNYWVSVEHVNESGETFAVIAPNAKRVSVPVQTNTSYDYKIVYKKQLKYNGNIISIANKTSMSENDTASFFNLTSFVTDLNGGDSSVKDDTDLAPTVQFINNTGKTLRVYNGQNQLTDYGMVADDYTLATGVTAFFTGFTDQSSAKSLNVRSVALTGTDNCDVDMTFENGKVYVVTATLETNSDTNVTDVVWTVVDKSATEFYTAE